MGFSGGTQHLQYYQPSVSSDGKLFVHKPESPLTYNANPETPHYLNLGYELHQGIKLDYPFFESSKMLEGSEIQLLKKLCEQERTQILTILMVSIGKPTSSRLHANWESLYVPQYRWQPRLSVSLPPDALSTTRDESML